MYKKISKLWIICIGITLFVMCSFIGTLSMFNAFAEENTPGQTQVYEDKMQPEDVNILSDKTNQYVNLGATRLSEGDQGLSQLYYIENANYFLANPRHRENYKNSGDHPFGTCTTVAHQILLGYHNYYSDRRLIPEISSDGKRYLSENYGDLNLDPIFEYGPSPKDLGRDNIGTTDEVFYGIFDKANGDNTLIEMLLSQTIGKVAASADEFLEDCANGRTKNWTITNSNYNKQKIMEELNSGRPVIVGFDIFGGHSSHVVVAYGYATYNDELCYITHYGWGRDTVQMLVPESWLGYQVTMEVEHEHNLVDTGTIINNTHMQLNCTMCDCDNVDEIYTLNATNNAITGCKYDLSGQITIPSQINGKTITGIEANAFANQAGITRITLPSMVTNIGAHTFNGCTLLTTIALPAGLTYIGDGAFSGCSNLNITVSSSNPNYSAAGNILYNKNKTKLISAGKVDSIVNILDSVTEVAPYAFDGNNKLSALHIKNRPTIGEYAFANCGNLKSAYFYSYNVPLMGANAFLNDNFTLYVPHSKQPAYNSAFVGYTNSIASIPVKITFVSEGQNIETKNTYYGATISGLTDPFKLGYDFSGWYDNVNYTGTAYANSGLWDTTEDMTVYAKWTPKKFYIIFDGTGSEGLADKEVTYDAPIGPLPVIEQDGYEFAGWKNSRGEYYTEDTIWKDLYNVTLTSDVFSASYTVVLDKKGGTGGSDRVNPIYLSPMPSATAPTRTGYTFQGYFTEPEGKGTKYYNSNMTSAKNWDLAEDRTLYAYWIGNKYTVTLDNQYTEKFSADLTSNASNDYKYISFIPNTSGTITLWTSHTQGDPYLTLYDKDFTPLKFSDDDYGNRDAKIMYSVVSGNRYIIGFRAFGSSLTVGQVHYSGISSISYSNIHTTVEVIYGSNMMTKNIPTPTRVGYTFIQYNTDPRGQGTSYYYGPNIASDSNWDRTQNTTLYAVWEKNYYDITLNSGYLSVNESIAVGYGDEVIATNTEKYVFNRIGYDFKGFYSQPNGKGIKYFDYKIVMLYSEYCYELESTGQHWNMPADGEIYAYWQAISVNYEYEVVISNNDEPRKVFYQPFTQGQNATITRPEIEGYTYEKMWLNSVYYTDTSRTLENVQLKRDLGTNKVYLWYPNFSYPNTNKGGLFMVYAKNECIAAGSMITLADGSQKAVETLTGSEMLLVWNLYTGRFDIAPIVFIDSDPEQFYKVINLYFSDGTQVKVISEHAFWDFNLNQYVYLREDAAQYIGHWFNKQTTDTAGDLIWTRVQLVNVEVQQEYTTAWSPVTYGHLCYFVNGMLSLPGGIDGLFNIFEVDPETMMYDMEQMQADIAQYGLYTYEEFAAIYSVPQEIFEAFNAQYFKVAIGKGMLTSDMLERLIDRYAEFFIV